MFVILLVIGVKFDAACSALWIVLPVCHRVVLAALGTLIVSGEFPVLLRFHKGHAFGTVAVATVD